MGEVHLPALAATWLVFAYVMVVQYAAWFGPLAKDEFNVNRQGYISAVGLSAIWTWRLFVIGIVPNAPWMYLLYRMRTPFVPYVFLGSAGVNRYVVRYHYDSGYLLPQYLAETRKLLDDLEEQGGKLTA